MTSRSYWFWIGLSLLTLGGNAAIWYGSFPLGVPGEWTWERRPPEPDLLYSVLALGMIAGLFGGFVWLGGQRLSRCWKWEVGVWLCGLVVAGFGWLWMLQEAAPFQLGLSKAAWILYYSGSSGYFTEARYRAGNLDDFLAGYEQRLAKERDVLHIGTHPPGLIVGYRGLMRLCQQAPQLQQALLATQPRDVRAAFEEVRGNSIKMGMPLLEGDQAVLWLAAMLLQLGSVLTVIPLYLLCRRNYSRVTSWLTVSFWPVVPAVAVFLPKSDALFPLIGVTFLYFWLEGWSRRSAARCLAAGLTAWLGLFLSLALLPVIFLAGLLTLWEGWFCRREERGPEAVWRLCMGCLWSLVGFSSPCLAVWFLSGMNLLGVWIWNYRNHAGFYAQFPRTYWKWLLVNPLELAVAAGLPVAALAVAGCVAAGKAPRSRCSGVCWATAATWGCLWLSGKNMGEAARLWLVLMPTLLWMAPRMLQFESAAPEIMPDLRAERKVWLGWAVLWGLQVSAAVVIVTRVVGFHLPT